MPLYHSPQRHHNLHPHRLKPIQPQQTANEHSSLTSRPQRTLSWCWNISSQYRQWLTPWYTKLENVSRSHSTSSLSMTVMVTNYDCSWSRVSLTLLFGNVSYSEAQRLGLPVGHCCTTLPSRCIRGQSLLSQYTTSLFAILLQ